MPDDQSVEPRNKACLVVGAGDATGGAIARAFAQEGMTACLVRRPRHADALQELARAIGEQGGKAVAMPTDARDEEAMIALVNKIEAKIGPLEVAVFNIGANVNFPITETSARVYRKVWEMAAFSGFLLGREAARVMLSRKRGTIIFTGATASMRGGAGYSAFAGAKFALRALAQSMARELGPHNIHVAHVVVDGMIDSPFIRDLIPEANQMAEGQRLLSPESIAKNYVWLHHQPKDAWTHEIDLRPAAEKW